eukprot:scaffold46041_cov57-Attheya_sp.AAC.2
MEKKCLKFAKSLGLNDLKASSGLISARLKQNKKVGINLHGEINAEERGENHIQVKRLNCRKRTISESIFSIFEDIINPFLTAQEPGVYVYTCNVYDTPTDSHTAQTLTHATHQHSPPPPHNNLPER